MQKRLHDTARASPLTREHIIAAVMAVIRRHLGREYRVALFGSWARGDSIDTSDLDIGILGEGEIPLTTLSRIREEVGRIPTLRSIDIVDLVAAGEEFRTNILKDAKMLE